MRQFLFIVTILLNTFQASGQDSKINDNGFDEKIFNVASVQVKPVFPFEHTKVQDWSPDYNDKAMFKFLRDSLRYPDQALPNNIEGKVVVSFIVRKSGKIDQVKILRGLSKEIDDEAIRLTMSMPDWIPGTNNKIPVNTSYVLPIHFKPRLYKISELDIQPVFNGDIDKLKKKLKRQLNRRGEKNVSQAIVEINTKGEIVHFNFGVLVDMIYFESIMTKFSKWSPAYVDGKAVWCAYPLKLDD